MKYFKRILCVLVLPILGGIAVGQSGDSGGKKLCVQNTTNSMTSNDKGETYYMQVRFGSGVSEFHTLKTNGAYVCSVTNDPVMVRVNLLNATSGDNTTMLFENTFDAPNLPAPNNPYVELGCSQATYIKVINGQPTNAGTIPYSLPSGVKCN